MRHRITIFKRIHRITKPRPRLSTIQLLTDYLLQLKLGPKQAKAFIMKAFKAYRKRSIHPRGWQKQMKFVDSVTRNPHLESPDGNWRIVLVSGRPKAAAFLLSPKLDIYGMASDYKAIPDLADDVAEPVVAPASVGRIVFDHPPVVINTVKGAL